MQVPGEDESVPSLLDLPAPCLLAVLQCCAANDQRNLFSAARAHSRLHQAAVTVLHSISTAAPEEQQVDSVLLYLDRHGSHVDSPKMRGRESGFEGPLTLEQFPPDLQLHSLDLAQFHVQLLPGNGSQGVLATTADADVGPPPLKQLRFNECILLDGAKGLAAALQQLPVLEHLSLHTMGDGVSELQLRLPTRVLQQLQQLTYLELAAVTVQRPDWDSPALQPLQALTRLADLRLADLYPDKRRVSASLLSSMCHLTRLALVSAVFEPVALAGKAKL
jgi:hypothetical protein